MGESTPTSVCWKDDNVKDEGAPDPRTVQFRPGRKPGIHLTYFMQGGGKYLFFAITSLLIQL
jgi:hypothetical protein